MTEFPLTREEFRSWLLEKLKTEQPIATKIANRTCCACPLSTAAYELKEIDLGVSPSHWSDDDGHHAPLPSWARRFVRRVDSDDNKWKDIPASKALKYLDAAPKGPTS